MTLYILDKRSQAFKKLEWAGDIDHDTLSSLGYKIVKEDEDDVYLMRRKSDDPEKRRKALFDYASMLQRMSKC